MGWMTSWLVGFTEDWESKISDGSKVDADLVNVLSLRMQQTSKSGICMYHGIRSSAAGSALTATSAHPLEAHRQQLDPHQEPNWRTKSESQIREPNWNLHALGICRNLSEFTCCVRLIFFPAFFDIRWSQQNALIRRHSNCFPPKNWMNPFRYVLGTRRWLVFAIYCLLEGQEA